MTDHNRNGHLSRFEDYAPIKRSLDEVVEKAIAFKNGDKGVYDEPEPTVVARSRPRSEFGCGPDPATLITRGGCLVPS